MNLMQSFSEAIKQYRDKKHIEIELRIGKINHHMFDTNVGQEAFQKLTASLDLYKEWEKVIKTQDDVFYWDNGVRCIYDGVTTTYQKKNNILKKDLKLENVFDVRLAIAQEIPVNEQTDEASHTVTRSRTSYLRKNVRIDMTIVTGQPLDKDVEDITKYQVELEILDASSDQKIFSALHKVLDVLKILK